MTQIVAGTENGALDAALSGLEFAPGTNPNGDLSFADWRFLLPDLRFESVLFVGAPSAPALAALARTVGTVVVAAPDPTALARVRADASVRGLTDVHPLLVTLPARLPFAEGSFDLVVLGEGAVTSRALVDAEFADELARVLCPEGTIYLGLDRRIDTLRARRWTARLLARGFDAPQSFWLMRRRAGGLRLAFPLAATRAVQYAFDDVLYANSRKAEALRWIGRCITRAGLHRHAVPDRALVFNRRRGQLRPRRHLPGPARYLSALAADAGVDLGSFDPGFFARGGYDSNKVAFFLFREAVPTPDVIVKMTRAPRYNHRLEAEHRALTDLRARGLADDGSYPESLFFGHHHDLAVLAQRVVPGAPFRTRTRGDPGCRYAKSAIAWIHALGARSAQPAADPSQLQRTLLELLTRFTSIYSLSATEHAFLRERVESLGSLPAAVPTVFQHGDAGTWNVVVTADHRAAFLDWEFSRARGIPLWDLVDFLRSFGSWAARAGGETNMVRAYTTRFLAPSPFSELQADAVRAYSASVGLPREAVEPLFFACWMQRAVREAAWTRAPLGEAMYVNLVRACIQQRDAVGSRWLFD